MRIISLCVHPIKPNLYRTVSQKNFQFDEKVTIVFSNENSTGKTTLLRILLHSLGYNIPSTGGFNFSDYKTVLKVIGPDSEEFVLSREQNTVKVQHKGEDKLYALPSEQNDLHSVIFGIQNLDVIENILGIFYFDQEYGWTFFYRRKAIGSVYFSIESLLCGLSNNSHDELSKRLVTVKRDLKKYRYMLDVVGYPTEINESGDTFFVDSPADKLEETLDVLYCERKQLEEERDRIKNVIHKNIDFEKYITSLRLRVKTQNGEEIPVNKKTLADLEDTSFLLEGKATLIKNKIATLDKKIEPLKRKQEEQETILFALNTNMNKINSEIPRISIDVFATKRIILKLEKERKDLNESHLQSLKPNKLLIAEFHAEFQQLITTYATRLDLDKKYYTEKNDFIFTHDHKSLSGAILNTLVFVFKISSVRMVQNHTGVCLPIILDSPYGGEIRPEIVKKMMAILSDDFSDHQVIIASLHKNKDFPNPNVIELTDRLLPF